MALSDTAVRQARVTGRDYTLGYSAGLALQTATARRPCSARAYLQSCIPSVDRLSAVEFECCVRK